MRHRMDWLACSVVVLALSWVPATDAEVRVKTDRYGEYRVTQVTTGTIRWVPRVWSLFGRPDVKQVLNPEGDRNGDLWPAIAENSLAPHYPWVVWSRRNGQGYDLAWSHWNREGWQPIRWLESESSHGDDLDADLTFDATGRPYIAWWRQENGVARVYMSIFLAHEWMRAYAVSDASHDARFPSIEVLDEHTIRVEYETAEGQISQLVEFIKPVTITDDINPLDHLRHNGAPVIIGRNED